MFYLGVGGAELAGVFFKEESPSAEELSSHTWAEEFPVLDPTWV